MPLIDGELAGDDGGAAAVAFLEDHLGVVTGRGEEIGHDQMLWASADVFFGSAESADITSTQSSARRR